MYLYSLSAFSQIVTIKNPPPTRSSSIFFFLFYFFLPCLPLFTTVSTLSQLLLCGNCCCCCWWHCSTWHCSVGWLLPRPLHSPPPPLSQIFPLFFMIFWTGREFVFLSCPTLYPPFFLLWFHFSGSSCLLCLTKDVSVCVSREGG